MKSSPALATGIRTPINIKGECAAEAGEGFNAAYPTATPQPCFALNPSPPYNCIPHNRSIK